MPSYNSKVALTMFTQMLREWADAVDADKLATADTIARTLPHAAELITVHEEFRRHFGHACPNLMSETVLEAMSRLMLCVTKAQGDAAETVFPSDSEKRLYASDRD